MESAICTLFEGHYHYGVAALTNSLYESGFTGNIYAGYRGALPKWAISAEFDRNINWTNNKVLNVSNKLKLIFLPLQTNYHFTNYKPEFMLRLWTSVAADAAEMFYFDPDIVLVAPWDYFEEWIEIGVALCEDVNSPLPQFHPRRMAWRKYFKKKGIILNFKDSMYVNGGFIGLGIDNKRFLNIWKSIQEIMGEQIGGLNRSALASGEQLVKELQVPFAPFGKTDQDALNITIECWEGEVSFVGKEGMGFKPGGFTMLHAIGTSKPWKKNFIVSALQAKPPTLADKAFWKYVKGPISTLSPVKIKMKNFNIKAAALVGRFYRRF